MNGERLFIVASRLPVCVDADKENAIRPASTKLVNAINAYHHSRDASFKQLFWVGIPGCKPTRWNEATNHHLDSLFTYLPVLLYKEQYQKYHHGFAKSVVYPLFYGSSEFAYDVEEYEHYISVNERYTEILEKKCRVNDTLWINDYHLLLLAGMSRKKLPEMQIEFFLHIPFPPLNVFELLPKNCQVDILRGMMGAGVVRFHSPEDILHFREAAETVLQCSNDKNTVEFNGRLIRVDLFGSDVKTTMSPNHKPEL